MRPWYRFWSLDGEKLPSGPGEWVPAFLEVRVHNVGWTELRLFRNGTPLALRQERLAGRVRTLASWPRSGPGRYDLKLNGPDVERRERISIWPDKIKRSEYERVLGDLEKRLPVEVAVALQNAGGLSGIELRQQQESTLEQELVRLRRAVRGSADRLGLAEVLRKLAGRPHRVLTSEERWVRRGRARRPSGDRLGQAYARPDNFEDGRLKQVPDNRSRHTTDVYENRLLLQFEQQVRFRLRRIELLLRERGDEEAAGEAATLLERLEGARREASFLDEVSALKRPPTRASQVLQKRPLYRAALQGYLEFQRKIGVALDAPEIEAPLNNLPFLYQLWCTLQLLEVVIDEAGEQGFRVDRSSLFRRKSGFLTLRLGTEAARLHHPETGTTVQVFTERSYGIGLGNGLRSISYSQRPDIAIEVTDASGETTVYLFDPKYKLDTERVDEETDPEDFATGRAKKPDLDKMHAYRDAIRDEEGGHVVRYAAILYPGKTERFSQGLEAIRARPGDISLLREPIAKVVREALR